MSDIDVSSIRDAIVLARDLAAVRERQAPTATAVGPTLGLSLPAAYHGASQQVLAAAAAKCGLDQQAFERIRTQNEAEVLRVHEAAHTDAVKRSGEVKKELRLPVESRRTLLEGASAASDPSPRLETIDAPFLIWSTPTNMLSESEITPWNSRAKFQYQSTAHTGYRSVTFYYLWENASDRYAVVDVDGYLILHGFVRVTQNGAWYAGDRWTSLTVNATMNLLEWWNQPPSSDYPLPGQSQFAAASLLATGGGTFDDGETKSAAVFRGYDLQRTLFLVPPHGVTVIEVVADVYHMSGVDGSEEVFADFESGDFEVVSPFVLIGVLS